MIRYAYILQNDHHGKSGQHLSAYIVTNDSFSCGEVLIVILLATFKYIKYSIIDFIHCAIQYIPVTYFTAGSFDLLTLSLIFVHPPPLASTSLFSVCVYELGFYFVLFYYFLLFILFSFIDSTYKGDLWYLSYLFHLA